MTSTPRRACLKSDYLKLKGTTFAKWLKDSNNLYINKNLAKYAKKTDLSDSIWFKDISQLQKFILNGKDEDYLTVYERCVRSTPELWKMQYPTKYEEYIRAVKIAITYIL